MAMLRILDIDVRLPESVRWTTDPPEQCRVFHTLDGTSVHSIRTAIENAAKAHGYYLKRTDGSSYLQRGEQQIEIHQIHPTRIGIRVDDAESLPISQVSHCRIGLAGFLLPIPKGAKIVPGRERHDPGSTSWSAEWRVYDSKANEIASQIHDALLERGLRSGGIWPPPMDGIPRWKVEAYSSKQLVQASITDSGDHLNLTLTLIGETEEPFPPQRD